MSDRRSLRARWFPNHEWVLAAALMLEIAVFAAYGDNFLTIPNAFEISRLTVEVGLLALGMTVVIKTGGIDLSVGSMMALTVVCVGMLWKDAGLGIWVAAALGIAIAAVAGLLNGVLITAARVPPLIVTLATMSLYRGLAEGVTGGYTIYTGFPESFMYLGNGYIFGSIPTQLPVFIAFAALFWILLHRTVQGRWITALGFGEPGARFAGIPTTALLRRTYLLSGLVTGVAAVVYMSHIGQAKANAGMGYELLAITAVVLGGASITGGRGTILGTVLGMACLNTLQNGMRLSGQVSELSEMLIGCILVATLLLKLAVAALSARKAIRHVLSE